MDIQVQARIIMLIISAVQGEYERVWRRMVTEMAMRLRLRLRYLRDTVLYQGVMSHDPSIVLTVIPGEYERVWRRMEMEMAMRLRSVRDPVLYQGVMTQLLTFYTPRPSDDAISRLCRNHSQLFQQAFLQDQLWALQMFDATSKFPAGFLEGNFQDLGNFDECLSAQEHSHLFSGQMCLVQTRGLLPSMILNYSASKYSLTQALPLDLTLAVCVPSSCSPADVEAHFQAVMTDLNASASVSPMDCSVRDDHPLELHVWVALTVLGALALVVIYSTYNSPAQYHSSGRGQNILSCFSASSSLNKLVYCERRPEGLEMLDGVRFLAVSWFVIGHRFQLSLQVPRFSLVNDEKYTRAWFMYPVLSTMLAVELFLLLSGCILAYSFLQDRAKGQRFNLAYFYFKRYVRLTPRLALIMMLEGCLMLSASDGPVWKRLVSNRRQSCVDYWWTNLLYISNYINPYKTCVLQTWYLSVDMQLYVLSPLLLLPLSYSLSKGLVLIAVCYFSTSVASYCNALYLSLPARAVLSLDPNHGYGFVKTHLRSVSWLTGLALGCVLHHCRNTKHKYNFTKMKVAGGWMMSLSACSAAVYTVTPFQSPDHKYSPLLDSLYISLHRNIFSLGVSGIILLCAFQRGGFVNDILSWGGFRPLATLSYNVYLCHMGLQMITLARIRQPLDFDMFMLFTGFLSDLLLSNLVALLFYISVESPFCEIGSWFYNPRKKTSSEKYLADLNLEDEVSVL